MSNYTLSVSILQTRLYEVNAESEEEAKDILLEDFGNMEYDVVETEVDDIEVID